MTITILNTKISEVANKIPDTNSLVTATVLNVKFSKTDNEIPDRAKYITTQKLNKLATANFAARLEKANLVTKTDVDNSLKD